jgi:hypothetical protein
MIKHKYSTTLEVGDDLEFCVIVNKISNVKFGRIISINSDTKTVDFECLDYGKKMAKKTNGNIYKNVDAIRGIGYIHKDTWVK